MRGVHRTPRTRYDNGRNPTREYVATVNVDHYVIVTATSLEMAERKALEELLSRYALAVNPAVTNIEEVA